MRVKRNKILMIVGVVSVLIAIAAIVIVLSFDVNSYKSHIETTASKASHLDVRINGKMGFSFFPLGISVNDIHVANKVGEILSLKKLKMGVELIPLLKKQFKVASCELFKPTITIVKDADGKFNFENSEEKSSEKRLGVALSFKEISLSQGVLVYLDKKSSERMELKDVNLDIKDFWVGDTSGSIIKKTSFTGNLNCKEARKKSLKINNVKCSIMAKNGVISFIPLTMDIFGSKAIGDAMIEKSDVRAEYKINLKVLNLDFAKFEESYGTKKEIGGKGDLYATLTIKEKESRTLISCMDGKFSLQGNNLIIYTMDLDKVLSLFEASQEFNLIDLGAFFIAGPLTNVALKGFGYADAYTQAQGGQSTITHFISLWNIKDGVADATDCAFATKHNRIALKGKVNLVSERYENMSVALLDEKGCAKFQQRISGSFDRPKIDEVSVAESLAAPIINLYRKAKQIVQDGKCKVFYNGSVQQP